jgi:hypothetical protein
MLTPQQYTNCMMANQAERQQGRKCIIGGVVRNDLSDQDCLEAQQTGCVQRLLTPQQYSNCLNAQRYRR